MTISSKLAWEIKHAFFGGYATKNGKERAVHSYAVGYVVWRNKDTGSIKKLTDTECRLYKFLNIRSDVNCKPPFMQSLEGVS